MKKKRNEEKHKKTSLKKRDQNWIKKINEVK